MKRPRIRWRLLTILLALFAALPAVPAWGQGEQPQAVALKTKKPWFQWIAGVGFLLVVLIPVFKDPKRGHH